MLNKIMPLNHTTQVPMRIRPQQGLKTVFWAILGRSFEIVSRDSPGKHRKCNFCTQSIFDYKKIYTKCVNTVKMKFVKIRRKFIF